MALVVVQAMLPRGSFAQAAGSKLVKETLPSATAPNAGEPDAVAPESIPFAAEEPAKSGKAPGYLGVYIMEMTEELAAYLGYEGQGGVVVRGIIDNSPAAKAGLQKGDVLVEFNGLPLYSAFQLTDLVAQAGADATADLTLVRDSKELTFAIALGRGELREGTRARYQRGAFGDPLRGTPNAPGPLADPHNRIYRSNFDRLAPPGLAGPQLFLDGPNLGPPMQPPLAELRRLLRELDAKVPPTMFDQEQGTLGMIPEVQVFAEADKYVARAKVGTLAKENITLDLAGSQLIISGKMDESVEERSEDGTVLSQRRQVGTFTRTVHFPGAIDCDAVTARLEDDMLIVEAPKAAAGQVGQGESRQVPID